jgi:hypothetical protein
VTNVEFYVDGVLKAPDASSPYSMTLDSNTLSNASHSLTAKAYDAAGLSATSTAVAFTVNNTTPPPAGQFNEVESNGSVAAANTVANSYKTIVGTMGNTTDKDYFKLSLAANETVKVDMAGGPARRRLRPVPGERQRRHAEELHRRHRHGDAELHQRRGGGDRVRQGDLLLRLVHHRDLHAHADLHPR